jgi:hypothetical protein
MFEYAAIFTSRERAQLHRVNRSARKTDMIAKKRERFAMPPFHRCGTDVDGWA